MTTISKGHKRILRRPLIKIGRNNVLMEHNYSLGSKMIRGLKYSTDLTKTKIVYNNIYYNKCKSLPDWLVYHNLPSEEEDDFEEKTVCQLLIMEFQKDSGNAYKVCPPFDWIHLIYLTIKNCNEEYVTCHDVDIFCRHWFPYYLNKSWINNIISTLSCPSNQYFNYSSAASFGKSVRWAVNIKSVNTLEDYLMSNVKKYETKIKSAMTWPDKLPTILKGYGVHYLGYNR